MNNFSTVAFRVIDNDKPRTLDQVIANQDCIHVQVSAMLNIALADTKTVFVSDITQDHIDVVLPVYSFKKNYAGIDKIRGAVRVQLQQINEKNSWQQGTLSVADLEFKIEWRYVAEYLCTKFIHNNGKNCDTCTKIHNLLAQKYVDFSKKLDDVPLVTSMEFTRIKRGFVPSDKPIAYLQCINKQCKSRKCDKQRLAEAVLQLMSAHNITLAQLDVLQQLKNNK